MAIDRIPQKKRLALCEVIVAKGNVDRAILAANALCDLYASAGYSTIARSLRRATLAEVRTHAQGILYAFKE